MKGKKASISQDWTKSFYVIPASVRRNRIPERLSKNQWTVISWTEGLTDQSWWTSVGTYSSEKNAWHLFWKASFCRPSILVEPNDTCPYIYFNKFQIFSNLFLDMCVRGTSFIKFCKPLNKGHCKITGRGKSQHRTIRHVIKKSKLKTGLARCPSFKQHFRLDPSVQGVKFL